MMITHADGADGMAGLTGKRKGDRIAGTLGAKSNACQGWQRRIRMMAIATVWVLAVTLGILNGGRGI